MGNLIFPDGKDIQSVLKNYWEYYHTSPKEIWVAPATARRLIDLAIEKVGGDLVEKFAETYTTLDTLEPGTVIMYYLNPFVPGAELISIPVRLDPNVMEDTILFSLEAMEEEPVNGPA